MRIRIKIYYYYGIDNDELNALFPIYECVIGTLLSALCSYEIYILSSHNETLRREVRNLKAKYPMNKDLSVDKATH